MFDWLFPNSRNIKRLAENARAKQKLQAQKIEDKVFKKDVKEAYKALAKTGTVNANIRCDRESFISHFRELGFYAEDRDHYGIIVRLKQ